jgi:CBS domain-containing protein
MLTRFRRAVVPCGLEDPIASVAGKMRETRVGCVVALRDGRPAGLLTDRDIVLRVVAEGRDPTTTTVADVVTYDPVTVPEDAGIETAVALMKKHGVRRLPNVGAEGRVVGIVTADDLVMLVGGELAGLCDAIEESADATESR